MQDDPKQSQKASLLIESLAPDSPGFVPLVSIIEFAWVLSSCYDLKRPQVAQAIDGILRTKEFVVERGAAGAGCEKTMTFDLGAAKSAGMTLIS